MISKELFNEIKDKSSQFKYTSFAHIDYDEFQNFDVFYYDKNLIVLFDESKSCTHVHFATNNFMLLINQLSLINKEIQIDFVPYEYKRALENVGFFTWAEYVDYFNYNLVETAIEYNSFDDIVFLQQNECWLASAVSKSCANQSRGFIGETTDWFLDWLNENDVIIVRQNDIIAGFCCVSIYNNGMNLWVREIAVDPIYQKKGLGKKLLEQAICYGTHKGATKGFLHADVLNDNAIKLYTKYGFVAKEKKGELQMRKISGY